MISQDEEELVQVQPTYLAFNWRRRDLAKEYPGYDNLSARFLALLSAVETGLLQHGGLLLPTRAELSYVNVIQPSEIWRAHQETHKLLNISIPPEAEYERLGFSYSQVIKDSGDNFVGRLHVTLTPTVDWLKQEQQLVLNLTARSADFTEQTINAATEFMNVAHAVANKTFLRLISTRAREYWRLP